MLTREDLRHCINEENVHCVVTEEFGNGSVLKLSLEPVYYAICPESSIEPAFWNVTKNVVQKMATGKIDFMLVLIDGVNEQLYVLDQSQTAELLKRASYEKTYGNYRITPADVENSVSLPAFCELIASLSD